MLILIIYSDVNVEDIGQRNDDNLVYLATAMLGKN